jgi:magnesium-transporting ATPase (P-type)
MHADIQGRERGQKIHTYTAGESNPITKVTNDIPGGKEVALGDRKNLAFSATTVSQGQGKGIVIATGEDTEIGKINNMVSEQKTTRTNLQVQLEIFGRWIAGFTILLAFVAFCLAFWIANEPLGQAFSSAVSIAVAIIPEGLPAVVTIALALAMTLLSQNNAIVKRLPSVETLGSVSVICSDKTGTLTKNEMTVQKIQTGVAQYCVQGVGYDPSLGTVCQHGTDVPLPHEHLQR